MLDISKINIGPYLIAGIGTEIGKTFFIENFCRFVKSRNQEISAIKPIISGFDAKDQNSDSARILNSLGREFSIKNIDEISPWRFAKPVAPCFAISSSVEINPNSVLFEKSGEINFEKLVEFCQKHIDFAKSKKQFLLIETAGGIMTPITFSQTFLDLSFRLKLPVLLISANYLGAISHTLTAIHAIKSQGLEIAGVFINPHFGAVVDFADLKRLFFSLTSLEVSHL